MPSPFPGMDPYLEAPDIWPDFHEHLASELGATLNAQLPPPYYARLESRPEVGITGDVPHRRIVPDVSVQRGGERSKGGVAVLDEPRTEVSEYLEFIVSSEPLRHQYVELRDSTRGHELVTLIEIVSPSNKKSGTDRRAYLAKQREVLDSNASLIEIDLLRSGDPVVSLPKIVDALAELNPTPQYVVSVNRAWQRNGNLAYHVFGFTVRDPLPCIPVPLREGETEIALDLEYVFRRAYDRGPYARGAVDYSRPPQPPLDPEDAAWAQALLQSSR